MIGGKSWDLIKEVVLSSSQYPWACVNLTPIFAVWRLHEQCTVNNWQLHCIWWREVDDTNRVSSSSAPWVWWSRTRTQLRTSGALFAGAIVFFHGPLTCAFCFSSFQMVLWGAHGLWKFAALQWWSRPPAWIWPSSQTPNRGRLHCCWQRCALSGSRSSISAVKMKKMNPKIMMIMTVVKIIFEEWQ